MIINDLIGEGFTWIGRRDSSHRFYQLYHKFVGWNIEEMIEILFGSKCKRLHDRSGEPVQFFRFSFRQHVFLVDGLSPLASRAK